MKKKKRRSWLFTSKTFELIGYSTMVKVKFSVFSKNSTILFIFISVPSIITPKISLSADVYNLKFNIKIISQKKLGAFPKVLKTSPQHLFHIESMYTCCVERKKKDKLTHEGGNPTVVSVMTDCQTKIWPQKPF